MRNIRLLLAIFVLIGGIAAWASEAPPSPLTRAHAHNDYMHKRPLLDALDQGFCSVEADINFVNGQILVAHSPEQAKPDRALQALYLEPLRERVKANGGHVYPEPAEFWLLIDHKTDAKTTYPALHALLEQYADILTQFNGTEVKKGAVTVVIDGADALIKAQQVRYASIDGRLDDLDSNAPASLIPWISADWKSAFTWKGEGAMPDAERAKLREFVAKAHEKGRKIRFWGLPLRPAVWPELYEAGVDLLNADNLAGMRKFLLEKGAQSK